MDAPGCIAAAGDMGFLQKSRDSVVVVSLHTRRETTEILTILRLTPGATQGALAGLDTSQDLGSVLQAAKRLLVSAISRWESRSRMDDLHPSGSHGVQ